MLHICKMFLYEPKHLGTIFILASSLNVTGDYLSVAIVFIASIYTQNSPAISQYSLFSNSGIHNSNSSIYLVDVVFSDDFIEQRPQVVEKFNDLERRTVANERRECYDVGKVDCCIQEQLRRNRVTAFQGIGH